MLAILDVNGGLGGRAGEVDRCCGKRWGRKHDVRIVGKAESLSRYVKEISVELMIFVFVVDSCDGIVAGRKIFPDHG